jgi:hypothetical protein
MSWFPLFEWLIVRRAQPYGLLGRRGRIAQRFSEPQRTSRNGRDPSGGWSIAPVGSDRRAAEAGPVTNRDLHLERRGDR